MASTLAGVGERVWVWGAQSYRSMGTAAELTVVPAERAAALPEEVSDNVGASLGIPGITAHRAVFGDGPIDGATVLVHGVRGGVGSLAAQLALWAGATVIGTVRRTPDTDAVKQLGIAHVVPLDAADVTERLRDLAPDGVDRVIEVSLSDNVDLEAAVLRVGGVIAAYASGIERPASRSGRCSSITSRSACWAATTFRSTPSERRLRTSPLRPETARCRS